MTGPEFPELSSNNKRVVDALFQILVCIESTHIAFVIQLQKFQLDIITSSISQL